MSPDAVMIDWVVDEVHDSLQHVSSGFQEYFANPDDQTALRFAATHLHQAQGTLQMAELDAAATLLTEAEMLIQAQLGSKIDSFDRFKTELLKSILVVDDCITQLNTGHCHDQKLLDSINTLRALRNKPPLSRFSFFHPDLAAYRLRQDEPAEESPDFAPLHRQFQRGLLQWLQQPDDHTPLENLAVLLDELEQAARLPTLGLLWASAAAVIENVYSGVLKATPEVKKMMGDIERRIKRFADDGAAAVLRDNPESLVRALLFELVNGEHTGKRGEDLLRLMDMRPNTIETVDDAESGQLERLASMQADLENQVATARLFLDDYFDPEHDDPETLQPLSELLNELRQVGVDEGKTGLEELLDALYRVCEGYVDARIESGVTVALHLAEGLLVLESSAQDAALNFSIWRKRVQRATENLVCLLDGAEGADQRESLAPPPSDTEYRDLLKAVADEIRKNLLIVEQSVTRFSEETSELDILLSAQTALHEITGVLEILDRKAIAKLARELSNAIEQIKQGEILPKNLLLESIALSSGAIEASVAALELERPDVEALSISALGDLRDAVSRARKQQKQGGNWVAKVGDSLGRWLDKPADRVARENLLAALESPDGEVFRAECQQICEAVRSTQEYPEKLDDELIGAVRAIFQSVTQRAIALDESSGKEPSSSDTAQVEEVTFSIDPALQKVFLRESRDHLKAISEVCEKKTDTPIRYTLRRAIHSLAGAAAALGLTPMSEASGAIEALLDTFDSTNRELGSDQKTVLADYHQAVLSLLKALKGEVEPEEIASRFNDINRLVKDQIYAESEASEAATHGIREHIDLTDVFRDEVRQLLADFQTAKQDWISAEKPDDSLRDMVRIMHTIKGGARVTDQTNIAELAYASERLLRRLSNQKIAPDQPLTDLFQQVFDVLHDAAEKIGKREAQPDGSGLIKQLDNSYHDSGMASVRSREPELSTTSVSSSDIADGAPAAKDDDEITAIFFDEADDILRDMDNSLQRLEQDDDTGAMSDLKRQFHTLKGGARMVGLADFGNLSHSVESMLQTDLDQGGSLDKRRLSLLHKIRTEMVIAMESVRTGQAPSLQSVTKKVEELTKTGAASVPVEALVSDEEEAVAASAVESEPEQVEKQETTPTPEPTEPEKPVEVEQAISKQPRPESFADLPARSTAVRVDIKTLDELVNQTSEIGVSRSRMRLRFSGFVGLLEEMQSVVDRFQTYFRDFEIEAETAIVSSPGQELMSSSLEFDPLELDRFSRLQQLTRSLSECVDDLSNVESGMERLVWQTETLFHQDAQIYGKLHEGLLKTRMQPVGILSGRLQHLVRTISAETGKEVNLELVGQNVELDRNILDRMTAPLEHMIRNALVHGIESPKKRKQMGKPARGAIRIEFAQVYNEVIMRFSDDGAGINMTKLRERAVAAGLADEAIGDHDLAQMVLESGVSTVDEVTQLSGRGVGMEVVASEIRYLGGHIDVESHPGKGVTFIIGIPLSLSMTRANLVRCGGQTLAIPLSSIVQVQSLSADDLAHIRNDESPRIKYRGKNYHYSALSERLGFTSRDQRQDEQQVLLIRSGKRCIALGVKEVLDTEECIIKPLNPQISAVRSITGVTILGDGEVALLLDPGHLRRELKSEEIAEEEELAASAGISANPAQASARVLIVDDSVTFRKVTGRLMERNGFQVDLARDGFDALRVLDERKPDLMLVDIEMPKMDGYELMARIKNNPQLANVPVIFITSRSGGKHRKKALDLGAVDYFSKPYDDSALIDRINSILDREQTNG